jgi:hypothetical protein
MKQKQLLPTVTVTVAAVAALGRNARRVVIITIITAMRSEKAFMTSKSNRILQTICRCTQGSKSNEIVTSL